MIIDFTEFMLKGQFGPIQIGDTERRVLAVLGEPGHLEPSHRSYPTTMLYGTVELRFDKGTLSYCSIDLSETAPEYGKPLDIKNIPVGDLKMLTFVTHLLQEHRIVFSVDPVMTDDSQTVLTTERGVHLAFRGDGLLTKVAAVRLE